jgi:hypothetical protein
MRQHRAEPGSILRAAQWIPDSRFAASGMTIRVKPIAVESRSAPRQAGTTSNAIVVRAA